jgi:alpha-amylase
MEGQVDIPVSSRTCLLPGGAEADARLITDRFAPPSDTAPARTSPLPETCDPALQTWCGGTWLSIIDKLDYIHEMGMDAIWISPTSSECNYAPLCGAQC